MSAVGVGLAAIAAALGEIEPADPEGDVTREHLDRQRILGCAAPRVPVTSAADAALALSAAASLLGDVECLDLPPREMVAKAQEARRILGRVAGWMRDDLGASPLLSAWPADTLPSR